MHYTFLYALYMITGVQKPNDHVHSTPEKRAPGVTPIVLAYTAGLPQPPAAGWCTHHGLSK